MDKIVLQAKRMKRVRLTDQLWRSKIKKALLPGQGRRGLRGTTLIMDPSIHTIHLFGALTRRTTAVFACTPD